MYDDVFGITANSLIGVIPFYALVSIAACLLLVLAIRFWMNALSGSTPKAGPKLLHVVPISCAVESNIAQTKRHLACNLSVGNDKEQPLSAGLLSEEVKHLLEEGPARVAEPMQGQNNLLEFEAIEAPEIELCGGVEVAFERYCAAAKAMRLKNANGNSMMVQ